MSKPFVFVLMPFNSDFDDVYKLGIKQAVIDAGGYCERVDEQYYEERMLDRIYNQINKADLIIADLTGRNANVFYEVGYAHALEKRVILLTQNNDDIPFDLKHHFHILYDKISLLKPRLVDRVSWFINNPSTVLYDKQQLHFFVDGIRLENDAELHYLTPYNPTKSIGIKIDIFNSSEKYFSPNCKIGIVLNRPFFILDEKKQFREILLSDDKVLFVLKDKLEELLPNSWTDIDIDEIKSYDKNIEDYIDLQGLTLNLTLKLYTQVGTKDIDFSLTIPDLRIKS